jgi:hypothetical protein
MVNNQFNTINCVDSSGRLIKSDKQAEKPICDSDNTKTTTRLKRIDGSMNLKREDLIIDENAIDKDLLVETNE